MEGTLGDNIIHVAATHGHFEKSSFQCCHPLLLATHTHTHTTQILENKVPQALLPDKSLIEPRVKITLLHFTHNIMNGDWHNKHYACIFASIIIILYIHTQQKIVVHNLMLS